MSTVPERLAALRAVLNQRGLDAYLVPSSDEHLNEYLPDWRQRRAFASGFTGSAGDLLVLAQEAWLYADGRYHLQAEDELQGSGITLMPVGAPGAKPLGEHLEEMAAGRPGLSIGIDPMVVPLATAEALERRLSRHGGTLVEVAGNLIDPLWAGRPAPATSPLIALPTRWTGTSVADKIALVRKDLDRLGADAIAVVKLDQIAWLLNLRSQDDVPYNPVFESFLYLAQDAVHLFIRDADTRLPPEVRQAVPGLQVHGYDAFVTFLASATGTVLIDPAGVTRGVASALKSAGCTLRRHLSPIEERAAIKSTGEQDEIRRANLGASVAKTRALIWLRREVAAGRTVTEAAFRDRLESLYAAQEDFAGLSFNTIAATGDHGAIVHYGACDETPLAAGDLFLIDSGCHIGGGTTDDTRTVAVGGATPKQRRAYTLVLKGHINAARQVIPDGASGATLDALARSPLWNAGLNYDHGTGHGVGAYLCVHEGPFAIAERERRPNAVQPLKAGIVSSIEPGYYEPGWGGIRIENLYLYNSAEVEGSTRSWLELEPLTWIPMDRTLIDEDLLEAAESTWLRDYHRQCLDRLLPHLPRDEQEELRLLIGG